MRCLSAQQQLVNNHVRFHQKVNLRATSKHFSIQPALYFYINGFYNKIWIHGVSSEPEMQEVSSLGPQDGMKVLVRWALDDFTMDDFWIFVKLSVNTISPYIHFKIRGSTLGGAGYHRDLRLMPDGKISYDVAHLRILEKLTANAFLSVLDLTPEEYFDFYSNAFNQLLDCQLIRFSFIYFSENECLFSLPIIHKLVLHILNSRKRETGDGRRLIVLDTQLALPAEEGRYIPKTSVNWRADNEMMLQKLSDELNEISIDHPILTSQLYNAQEDFPLQRLSGVSPAHYLFSTGIHTIIAQNYPTQLHLINQIQLILNSAGIEKEINTPPWWPLPRNNASTPNHITNATQVPTNHSMAHAGAQTSSALPRNAEGNSGVLPAVLLSSGLLLILILILMAIAFAGFYAFLRTRFVLKPPKDKHGSTRSTRSKKKKGKRGKHKRDHSDADNSSKKASKDSKGSKGSAHPPPKQLPIAKAPANRADLDTLVDVQSIR
ncbi:unnamed protein product, partial [Mesorhabditis spiculigera]